MRSESNANLARFCGFGSDPTNNTRRCSRIGSANRSISAYVDAYFFAGWRYVLSPRYREAKAKEWHTMRQTEVMGEIVGGVTGVVVSVLLPVFLWWGMRNGA